VEGAATALVVSFVAKARPEILTGRQANDGTSPMRTVIIGFLVAAAVTGGVLSWFASGHPDGLEWSVMKMTGKDEVEGNKGALHSLLEGLQGKTAILPDYSFRKTEDKNAAAATSAESSAIGATESKGGRLGTSLSGLVGGLLTLAIVFCIGTAVRLRKSAQARDSHVHEHSHTHHHLHEHPHRHASGTVHSHPHGHEHSHPHPHRHEHNRPHHDDPNPGHAHAAQPGQHEHGHDGHDDEPHIHDH
jgi:hypothetical protein